MLDLERYAAWIVKKDGQTEKGKTCRDGRVMVMMYTMRGN